MSDQPVCDLCAAAPGRWAYAAEGLAGRDVFAACELCRVLVDRRDLKGLERRCVTLFVRRRRRRPHPEVVALLRATHRGFLASITAGPTRIGADQ